MSRVRADLWIVVPAGVCERIFAGPGTGAALMNMEPKDIGGAWPVPGGKAVDLREEHHPVRGLVK